ncbi:hypothetical protein HX001_12595 [Empedobacter brevis]|uniref:Hyaluronidase n=1 Tax=Empedobacter brevis TaxID=247 RepID=A0AAJ1QFZ5_9FLAO|nr:hypothetical protein [Empedobacter brevis]MDM1073320.1 hypothetical protein [Empedobacter brevis]
MKNIILLFIIISSVNLYSQEIPVYAQQRRYSEINCKSCIRNYYFFGEYYIDRNKKNIIDLKTLEAGINKIVEDVNSTDLIVLDIENKIYQDIKIKSRKDKDYKKNIEKLVEMVQFVKKIRPKSKVVLYGIPFNFNYSFQKDYNDYEKLKPLLNAVDYLSPSLYLMYSNKERDVSYFKNYIESNLELTFQFASKVNKEVLPFIWYKVHPYNKKYGNMSIEDNSFKNYINTIKNFRYQNKKVKGLIYWESSKDKMNINGKLEKTIKILN